LGGLERVGSNYFTTIVFAARQQLIPMSWLIQTLQRYPEIVVARKNI
jgi:hypothetical protein